MDTVLFGIEVLPAQIQAANPLLVMLLIPVFSRFHVSVAEPDMAVD